MCLVEFSWLSLFSPLSLSLSLHVCVKERVDGAAQAGVERIVNLLAAMLTEELTHNEIYEVANLVLVAAATSPGRARRPGPAGSPHDRAATVSARWPEAPRPARGATLTFRLLALLLQASLEREGV